MGTTHKKTTAQGRRRLRSTAAARAHSSSFSALLFELFFLVVILQDTPYNSRWYCLNQLRGCEEFYVSTSSSSKTAHTAICPFALAPVKYSPAQLKEIREKLRKEADARAEQATKRLAAEAEAAAAAGDEHAAGGSTKHSHGSKHNKSSSSAVSAGTVLHSSSSSAFRKLHVSSSSAAAAGAPAGPTSGSHFAYVQGTKAAKMISADTAAAAAAVAKKNKRVRAPKATATVAIKDEDDSEFEEDRPASPRSAGKKPPKRARKRSLTTDAITQSTVALAAAAATVSNAAVPPSLTPAAFQAFHSQAAVAVESAQRGNMPPALPLQRQLGFQPKEYLSFAATAGGSGVGGDLTSHFRLAAEQQIQARVMSQGGEGTVASHSPYTTATAVSLGHSPFSQAIAARPLLSQASIFPHNQSAHVTSSPLVDAQLQQQRHQYMPSMYAAAQAAAHSPASTGTLMLTPNPHQPFTPSASATTVAAAASAAAAAAAAHFRLPASVFDPEGVGAPLQIDLLSYKLGLEHAAKAAEQKRQALRAANAGSKRKNGTADAVPSPIVASADVSVKTAPKRAKLPTFSPLLPAAALSGGGFQPQLMPALTIPDPQQQQQLHQHFSLHASETNLSMSRESTAATAVTAPMHGGLDGYGAGELSVNAASMMRAHLAGHSHFSSSHSSPMPRLHMRGGPHETAGRSGVATQEGTCGSSTTSSARVFQSHQSRDGESAEHGLPRCPSPGARAQQQQQRDGWASAPDTSPHLDQQHQLVFSPQIVPKQTVPALQLEGVVDGDRDRDAADADTGSPIVETSFAEGQQSHHMHAKLSFEPASKLDLMGGGGGVAVEEGNVIVAHSSGADSVMRTPRLNQFVTDGDLRPLFSPGDLPAAVLSSTGATAVGSGVASTPRSGGPGLQYPSSPLPNPPVLSRSLCMLGGGKANSRPNSSLGDMMQRITQQQQQQQQQQAQQATAPTQQAHSPMRIQASVQPPPDDLLARLEAQRADLIRQLEVQQRLLRAQNALAQATQQEDPSLMQLQLEAKELARQRSYLIQLQRLQIDQAAAMREANAPFLSQFASVPPPQMNAQTLAHIMQQTQLGQARQQQAHQQWMQQEAEQQRRVASMRSAAAPLSVLHSPLLSSVPPPPPAPLPSDPSRRQLLHRMHALTTEQLHDIFRTHQRAT